MPWHPTNCAVQRSIRGRSTDEVVKVTPARPGGIFRRRCIERAFRFYAESGGLVSCGIDQTELVQSAAPCVDHWRVHDRSFCLRMKASNNPHARLRHSI